MTDEPRSAVEDASPPEVVSPSPDTDALEALASTALADQVAHLRRELALAWEETADRERTIAELREVIDTRDEQIRSKDEDLRIHADYIRHLTRFRRMIPGWLRSGVGKGRPRRGGA